MKKRGLLIFISDLLSDQENILKALKYFRFRHHEVIVLQVLDPEEIKFGYSGESLFVSLENKNSVFADNEEIGAEYRRLFKEFLLGYKTAFHSAA